MAKPEITVKKTYILIKENGKLTIIEEETGQEVLLGKAEKRQELLDAIFTCGIQQDHRKKLVINTIGNRSYVCILCQNNSDSSYSEEKYQYKEALVILGVVGLFEQLFWEELRIIEWKLFVHTHKTEAYTDQGIFIEHEFKPRQQQ